MFNKKEDVNVQSLKNRISELEKQLIEVAEVNGNVIVKQLPSGEIELNGFPIDNTTEVEYYNSSKATYGELTMFRIGKESKQRELDKLIKIHMNEIDEYKSQIQKLERDVATYKGKSDADNDTIIMHRQNEMNLKHEINVLINNIENLKLEHNSEIETIKARYEEMIAYLNKDIESWKERYLTINNVKLDGTIITKYGELQN